MKASKLKKQIRHRQGGYTMAEFAPTLFLAFIMVVMPMLGFGCIALRYGMLVNAARLASQGASRSTSFLNNTTNGSITNVSAVNTAEQIAYKAVTGIGNGGVMLDPSYGGIASQVETHIIYQNLTTGGARKDNGNNKSMASGSVNTSTYIYTCEVIIHGEVLPLFPYAHIGDTGSMKTGIPGVTLPITAPVRWDTFFENPQGLTG